MPDNFLKDLDSKSVWTFTKQESDFEIAVKGTNLFVDYCKTLTESNIEDYYARHHAEYGIKTDSYRALVMAQLFGLITKTPFYSNSQYNKEHTTAVYDLIHQYEVGSSIYNKIKTEQILKFKIHAIIDNANNNTGYKVMPVLFIYKVLKSLQDRYGIQKISIDQLYTYIMTCKSYDEVDNAVEYIKSNAPVSELVSEFKSLSRVLTLIRKNVSLFVIDNNGISINPKFDNYFNENFILKFDLDSLHEYLLRDVDYAYFLYNYQGFNVNLIDEPGEDQLIAGDVGLHNDIQGIDYQIKIDTLKEKNINDDIAVGAHQVPPVNIGTTRIASKFERNPLLGKLAIKNAGYTCQLDSMHNTFISKNTHKQFMEAHHFIPINFQDVVWDKYKVNIDCMENLVSLCPICHRAFHYGTSEVKKQMIDAIYKFIRIKFDLIHLDIDKNSIYKFYDIEE